MSEECEATVFSGVFDGSNVGSIPKTHPTLFYTIPIGICGYLEFLKLGSEDGQRISRGFSCVLGHKDELLKHA